VPKVAQERRAVEFGVTRGYCVVKESALSSKYNPRSLKKDRKKWRTAVVPVALDVPMRVGVFRVVLLVAAHFDLLESPLGQALGRSAEVAPRYVMTEAQPSRERMYPLEALTTPAANVIDDLDIPVIILVTNRDVSVARHLVV